MQGYQSSTELTDLQNLFEASGFFRHMGFKIVRFEEGDVLLELPIGEHLANVNHIVHGGVFASMLDNIIGMTMRSIVKCPVTTINLNISFLAPASEGILLAQARVIHQGYRILTGEGEITDHEGKLLAKGVGTFKAMRKDFLLERGRSDER